MTERVKTAIRDTLSWPVVELAFFTVMILAVTLAT